MRQVLCIWVLSSVNENDDLFPCESFTRKWNISHETESCHIRMSRVWYTWVMSHMDGWLMCERCARRCAVRGGSRGMWHFKCKWVTSHMNASCRIRLSRVTYEWVMSNSTSQLTTNKWLWDGEVGGWGRVPFSRNLMSPTPRREWYLTTGRRFH